MITVKTLQLFCCSTSESGREALQKPWSRDDYTAASDGRVLVKVPRMAEVPENPDAPNIGYVLESYPKDDVEFTRMIKLPSMKARNLLGNEVAQLLHRKFDGHYLRLISVLTYLEIAARYGGINDPLPFRWLVSPTEGIEGQGLLMPMRIETAATLELRKDKWEKIGYL